MHNYEQLCVAGEGAYGVVLKCRHKETGVIVAIKKFREPDEDNEVERRMTQREVKILRALKHENIIQMKEAFRQKGLLYLVFEYVDKCLIDILEANPQGVDAETTRMLVYHLVRALEHCHRHHIIHRDIKPENLLISSSDGSLRLCDFGSACKNVGNATLTDYVATRWYRAPELLVRSNDYTAAVDIWGMGCVTAELMTGRALFAGKTDIDQICIIYGTLGPLTPEQSKRCMELTNYGMLKFPPPSERQTLSDRIGRTIDYEEMQFLERVMVVDPSGRLSADAALRMAWMQNAQAKSRRGGQPSSWNGGASGFTSARSLGGVCSPSDKEESARGQSSPRHQEFHTSQLSLGSTGPTQQKPRVCKNLSLHTSQAQGSDHRNYSSGYVNTGDALRRAASPVPRGARMEILSRSPSKGTHMDELYHGISNGVYEPAQSSSALPQPSRRSLVAVQEYSPTRRSLVTDPLEESILEDEDIHSEDMLSAPRSADPFGYQNSDDGLDSLSQQRLLPQEPMMCVEDVVDDSYHYDVQSPADLKVQTPEDKFEAADRQIPEDRFVQSPDALESQYSLEVAVQNPSDTEDQEEWLHSLRSTRSLSPPQEVANSVPTFPVDSAPGAVYGNRISFDPWEASIPEELLEDMQVMSHVSPEMSYSFSESQSHGFRARSGAQTPRTGSPGPERATQLKKRVRPTSSVRSCSLTPVGHEQ